VFNTQVVLAGVLVMLNWFRGPSKCPVDAETRKFIDECFIGFSEDLGLDRLINAKTFTPTEEFLPLQYDSSGEGVRELLERVAIQMGVDPNCLVLDFYDHVEPEFEGVPSNRSAGMYYEEDGYFWINLESRTLEDPVAVIGTLAHEVGHVILLGQELVPEDYGGHEPMTDLLTVYLGIGIFPANSVVHESNWRDGGSSGWTVGRRGYLSMDMFGYALALYALARNEPNPAWAVHLRTDVKSAFRQSVRYLQTTRDTLFLPALPKGSAAL